MRAYISAATLIAVFSVTSYEEASSQELATGEIVLCAIDIDSGNPIGDVVFFKSNSIAEDWFVKLGRTDGRGRLVFQSRPIPGYYFSVWHAPEGYKVVGLDDVASGVVAGRTVTHRFYLRKPPAAESFPEIKKVPKDQPNPIIAPVVTEANAYVDVKTEVVNMPGFPGRRVRFVLHSNHDRKISSRQLQLAKLIFYNGSRIAAAVNDELTYFQKAETSDKGRIKEMRDIRIEIVGPRHWRFWCRLPNGLPLKQHGYRVDFDALESWDLNIPDYLQPGFNK